METKVQKALKTVVDYYGNIPAMQRELNKYFHAYVMTDDFIGSDERERQRVVSNFEFLLDFFNTLKN